MEPAIGPIPSYLKQLLQPTPSGMAKLIAAWDGLQVETQIDILLRIGTFSPAEFPRYLLDKISRKAFESKTPYIRYLAVQLHGGSHDEWPPRIAADPDPLVRYSVSNYCLDDPKKFWALPHESRLRQVRYLAGEGGIVAKAVLYAMKNDVKDGRVSERDLYEVLADYVIKPGISQHIQRGTASYDGYVAVRASADFDALWGLVLEVSPPIAELLIKALPPEADIYTDIPDNVVAGLTDEQLATLLYRPNVALPKLRKQLFKTSDKNRGLVRSAAMSSHFCLDNTEFSEILGLSQEEKIAVLRDLATDTGTLMLCHYEAIGDVLAELDPYYADIAKKKCQLGLERLSDWPDWFQEKNILLFRLYMLARQVAQDSDMPVRFRDAELEFLAREVVPGDTWATFCAFETRWGSGSVFKDMERHLPRILFAGTSDTTGGLAARVDAVEQKLEQILKAVQARSDDIEANTAVADTLSQVVRAVEQKLEEILEALRERPGDINANTAVAVAPSPGNTAIAASIKAVQEILDEDAKMVTARVAALEKSNSKLHGLLWVVIVLTATVLLRTFWS
jgi:hypothetical protein